MVTVRQTIQRAVLQSAMNLPAPLLRRLVGDARRSPEGFPLDPQAQLLAQLIARLRPQLNTGPHLRARRDMEHSAPTMDLAPVAQRSVVDRTVPGPAGAIPVRIYTPRTARSPAPMLVFVHGGGWVIGSIDSYDGLCRTLADRAGVIIVSVGYRLAPEHRYPAQLDDALAATRWVLANAASLGGNPRAVAVGGDSAGGNLAALVALETRGDAARPAFQLLIYPATDLTRSHASHDAFRDGLLLTAASIEWFLAHYVSPSTDITSPRCSPFHAADLAGAPPALVITAGFDPLRDEGQAYAERLRQAGVAVEHRCYDGMIHGFFSLGGLFTVARTAIDDAADALARALAGPRVDSSVRPGADARAPSA